MTRGRALRGPFSSTRTVTPGGPVEKTDGASPWAIGLVQVRRVGIAERTADEAVVDGGALDAHAKERTVVRVDHLSVRKAPSGKQPELSCEASGGEDLVLARDQPRLPLPLHARVREDDGQGSEREEGDGEPWREEVSGVGAVARAPCELSHSMSGSARDNTSLWSAGQLTRVALGVRGRGWTLAEAARRRGGLRLSQRATRRAVRGRTALRDQASHTWRWCKQAVRVVQLHGVS